MRGEYSLSSGQPGFSEGLPPEGESELPGKAVPSQEQRAVDSGTRAKMEPTVVNILVISFPLRCWK